MASCTTGTVVFDERRSLRVYEWGTGPTVLLVHGWSGRGSQMVPFVAPLLEAGFRVVTYDAPGHGASEGRQTGLQEFADATLRVAATHGPIDFVVAHSLGAASTTIALSQGLRARRAVYLASPCTPGRYLYRLSGFLGFSSRVRDLTQRRIERRFGLGFAEADGLELAPQMNLPLVVFHDHGDREVPFEEGERLVDAWPGAELRRTEGLGHNRILSNPEVLAEVVDFFVQVRDGAKQAG